MRWWKVLGVAGFAGVAASGVLIVREERRRRACTPEEVRQQLHTRVADAATVESVEGNDRHRPDGRAGDPGPDPKVTRRAAGQLIARLRETLAHARRICSR